jgi:hypothetical protein
MTPSSGIVPASSVPIVVQTGQRTLTARLSVASRYRLVHLSLAPCGDRSEWVRDSWCNHEQRVRYVTSER